MRKINFYNLDAIISVGYRVNSVRSTQFRIWATKTLREYIIKGFVLDDERLKNAGEVSAEVAKKLAEEEYEKFRVEQDRLYESDFDREVKKVLSKGKSQINTGYN